jgi:hypothetical protein
MTAPALSSRHRLKVDGMSVVALRPKQWDGDIAVVLGHGAGKGMDSDFMTYFHRGLSDAGFLSVQFNFQYIEQGRKIPDHQNRLRASYNAVLDRVRDKFGPRHVFAGGKSMGGRVASYIAGIRADLSGLIFLGYPLHPAGKPESIRDAHLYESKIPMLFVSGTRDPLARPELLTGVVARIGRPATLESIDGGDHSLKVRRDDGASLGHTLAVVAAWTRNHATRS